MDFLINKQTNNCKYEYLVFALREGSEAQAVADFIVGAFRGHKTPRSREMSASRGYALRSVCAQFSFSLPILLEMIR